MASKKNTLKIESLPQQAEAQELTTEEAEKTQGGLIGLLVPAVRPAGKWQITDGTSNTKIADGTSNTVMFGE